MLCYIITRFSILDFNHKSFLILKNTTKEQYQKDLFSTKRLDYKFKSFEKITLPSVENQTYKNYIWYIYSSTYLPKYYKDKLLDLTKNNDKIKCIFIDSFNDFNKIEFTKNKYCTIRLDDDDGLSNNFLQNLQKYSYLDKVVISHPNGNFVKLVNDKIIIGGKSNEKNIALGLCAINMDIHNLGNHRLVHKNNKVIYDNALNMYLLNSGDECDSKRVFIPKNDKKPLLTIFKFIYLILTILNYFIFLQKIV